MEPGANASEIYATLKYIRPGGGFVPNFDMFAKSDVNGENENPIYTFLKSRCDPPRKDFSPAKNYLYDPLHGDDIRWNFEKFLIDHQGNPVRRYDESLDPLTISSDIDFLLQKLRPGQTKQEEDDDVDDDIDIDDKNVIEEDISVIED